MCKQEEDALMEVIYEDSNEEQNVSPDHKNKESQPKVEEEIQ